MSSQVQIVFWDVQHGHSTYLCSPNNRHIVMDLGTGSYGGEAEFSPLRHLKYIYGVNQLDYVIITHPHVDHIDDIFNFDSLEPRVILRPKHLDRKPLLDAAREAEKPKLIKYFEISDRYNHKVTDDSPDNPRNPSNFGGLIIKTFTPTGCSQANINNHSVVAVFEFAGTKALLPGDNEPPSWNELKEKTGFLNSTKNIDVLLAPHHGRKSGFDSETISHFNPRVTIVSDGRHCDSSASQRYSEKSRGWEVYRRSGSKQKRYCLTTRKDGVIVVRFGQEDDGTRFLNITID